MARFNVTVPQDGDYYVAVYGPEGGKYSLAPGYVEEFTVDEWLLIPWSVISIHLWEGQSPAYIFAPLVVVVIGGLALFVLYRRRRGPLPDLPGWLILVAGLLYLGGAAMTALQVVHAVQRTGYTPEVLLTLAFIAGPVILGIYAVSMGLRSPGTDPSPSRMDPKASVLTESGYTVIEAENGEQAVQLADDHRGAFQLLITDVVMPGMKGDRVASAILNDQPDVQVLFMSGYGGGKGYLHCHRLGQHEITDASARCEAE